ncbi:MAG: nitroreductase family protein [Deltaproteobacteria bacterium]|nr:nitroreductase family protein [Deltaproteobacteria bacterium]
MDVFEAIKMRHSVRSYQKTPVEPEKLDAVLNAARLAPSANNRQEWRFVVVTDKDTRRELAKAAKNQTFVGEAPVVIACAAKTDHHVMSCGQLCYPIDVTIAIDHMTLAATALGLGTCWIGAFFTDEVRAILNIPDDIEVVELLTLGYPTTEPQEKRRLPLAEIVYRESWSSSGGEE